MTIHTLLGRLLAFALAIMLTVPATVWADAATATEYYNQATVAYQQGDYQKAADLLDKAFGADTDLVYKYNRILALQALGDHEKALSELNTMYGPMKADDQNRFEDIDDIKGQLESSIQAKQNAAVVEEPDVVIEEPAPAAKKGPNIPAFALMGAGALLLGTGGLLSTGVFVPGEIRDCLDGNCTDVQAFEDPPMTRDEAIDHSESVQTTHRIAAVSFLAGGAIVGAVGVVLLVLDSGDEPRESVGLDSLQLSPVFSHDGVGAAAHFRF